MRTDQIIKETFKIFIDENGILNVIFVSKIENLEENTRQIKFIEEDFLKIFSKNLRKNYNILLDLLPIKDTGYVSNKSIKRWIGLANHKQVSRVAIIGSSEFLKIVTNFVVHTAGKRENMKWFNNKEEALKWLNPTN